MRQVCAEGCACHRLGDHRYGRPKPGSTWIVRDTGRLIQWMTPMHCLLLVGYDEKNYYFNDPWREAAVAYPRGDCTVAYDGFGRQAVVVYASAAQSSTSTIDGR